MSIERIDFTVCNGCGQCINSCPMDVIRLDTMVSDKEEFPPCQLACPAYVDIRTCEYLVREGMMEEAIAILREASPFPSVTGRVCPHPCEFACARKEVDEAVNISALERFIGDYWLFKEKAQPARQIYAARIGIVGSGPAGLSCAYFLAKMGYPVTVFEANSFLGGMLRFGIPEYRLPKSVLDAQIEYIRDMGVEFKTGVIVGKDVTLVELNKDYQAIFWATGSQLSRKIEVIGSEQGGILSGLDFLRSVNVGETPVVGNKVMVIGGGNVAVDAALTALRLGTREVQLVCLESEEEMPAYEEGIKQAREEGITISTSWGPKSFLAGNGRVTKVELVRCIRVFDDKGRFSPVFDESVTTTIEVDMVIMAVGQTPDLSFVPSGMEISTVGTIQVDPITLETCIQGVFAGGDVVTGTGYVVEAIAAGRRAAVSIDRYVKGEDLRIGREKRPKRVKRHPNEGVPKMVKQVPLLLPTSQRTGNFSEVKMGFSQDLARIEAQRCMTCGSRAVIKYAEDCQLCLSCERNCPVGAICVSPDMKVSPMLAFA